ALVRARKSVAGHQIGMERDHASMGPRSCERGNQPATVSCASLPEWLQWGRARASAEMPATLLVPHVARARFNGAALVRARKSRGVGASPEEARASMGPRSCERGNRGDGNTKFRAERASM